MKATQQTEIQTLRSEIECLQLQQELFIQNVEIANTSSVAELTTKIVGLQHETFVERAWRKI